jgi:tetratricopeptide (TPR) repeat protein
LTSGSSILSVAAEPSVPPRVRAEALDCLKAIGWTQELANVLSDANIQPSIQHWAAYLGLTPTTLDRDTVLYDLLQQPDAPVDLKATILEDLRFRDDGRDSERATALIEILSSETCAPDVLERLLGQLSTNGIPASAAPLLFEHASRATLTPPTRIRVATVIGQIGEPELALGVLTAIAQTPELTWDLRTSAAVAPLSYFDNNGALLIVLELAEAAEGQPEALARVAQATNDAGDQAKALALFQKVLRCPNVEPLDRLRAALNIGRLGPEGGDMDLLRTQASILVRAVARDRNLCLTAIEFGEVLNQRGCGASTRELLESLITNTEFDTEIRRRAAEVVCAAGPHDVAAGYLRRLAETSGVDLRDRVLAALALHRSVKSMPLDDLCSLLVSDTTAWTAAAKNEPYFIRNVIEAAADWPQFLVRVAITPMISRRFRRRSAEVCLSVDLSYREAFSDDASLLGVVREALQHETNDVSVLCGDAESAIDRGRRDLASVFLERALELQPQDAAALTLRARIHIDLGRYQDGLADLDEVLSQNPENGWVYVLRAIAYYELWQLRDAIDALNSAARLGEVTNWLYQYRGKCFLHLGLLELAIVDFDTAINADQTDAESLVKRASCNYGMGRFDRIESDLSAASQLGWYLGGDKVKMGWAALYRAGPEAARAAIEPLDDAFPNIVCFAGLLERLGGRDPRTLPLFAKCFADAMQEFGTRVALYLPFWFAVVAGADLTPFLERLSSTTEGVARWIMFELTHMKNVLTEGEAEQIRVAAQSALEALGTMSPPERVSG